MADKPTGLSCPLCLQADEPESMLQVHMTHGLAVREFDVSLCSQCVAAIVGAIESAAATAGLELVDQGATAEQQESHQGEVVETRSEIHFLRREGESDEAFDERLDNWIDKDAESRS